MGTPLGVVGGGLPLFHSLLQAVIGFLQALGEDLDLSYHGHKVSISDPSGDDVPVDMVVDPGTCSFSEVCPYVEPFGFEGLGEPADGFPDEVLDFQELFVGEVLHRGGVLIGGDHQVPIGVGEGIEHHEGGFPAVEDEVFAVIFLGGELHEDARGAVFPCFFNIFNAPGSPQALHRLSMSYGWFFWQGFSWRGYPLRKREESQRKG